MSSPKFFSYDPEGGGFEEHATEEEAKAAAMEGIQYHRDRAGDGWDYDVENICWGEIKGAAFCTKRETQHPGSRFDEIVDYELLPLDPPPTQPIPLPFPPCDDDACTESRCVAARPK